MLQATAISLGLVAEVIHDAGRTQIAAGSATVLGIGKASTVHALLNHENNMNRSRSQDPRQSGHRSFITALMVYTGLRDMDV